MAQASFTSLSLSLDSFLKPFLAPSSSSSSRTAGRHSQRLLSSLRCAPQPPTTTTTFVSPLTVSRLQTLSTFSRTHHLTSTHAEEVLEDVNKSPRSTLSDFSRTHHLTSTSTSTNTLLIRPMLDSEIDAVSELLAESFIETLFFPPDYTRLLAFLVKNYLLERRALLPHTTLLVGILSGDGGADAAAAAAANDQSQSLVCTAEISFDQCGANAASPTPVPPPDCPYICNMTVRKSHRRRGIGKLLLKTCEDLITKMTDKRDVYLHCRMVDKVPLRMYKKASYEVVKTDNFLVWLTLQRRKYLMNKTLTDSDAPKSEMCCGGGGKGRGRVTVAGDSGGSNSSDCISTQHHCYQQHAFA